MKTCQHCGEPITDCGNLAKYCETCRGLMKTDAYCFEKYMPEIRAYFEKIGYPISIVSANYVKRYPSFLGDTKLSDRGRSRALTEYLRTCDKYEVISRRKYQRIGGGI